jgi:signal transduction histidine kinase
LTAEERKEILYIAQEAMSNCLRHSGALIAHVSLRLQKEHVRLEVKDNGVGFDTKILTAEHRGLRNMTGRAARIGAKLDIASAHPRGTCLTLDVPLKRSQGDHP